MDMDLNDAIKRLGKAVAQDGGEADDAFDVVKGALSSYREAIDEAMRYLEAVPGRRIGPQLLEARIILQLALNHVNRRDHEDSYDYH